MCSHTTEGNCPHSTVHTLIVKLIRYHIFNPNTLGDLSNDRNVQSDDAKGGGEKKKKKSFIA